MVSKDFWIKVVIIYLNTLIVLDTQEIMLRLSRNLAQQLARGFKREVIVKGNGNYSKFTDNNLRVHATVVLFSR